MVLVLVKLKMLVDGLIRLISAMLYTHQSVSKVLVSGFWELLTKEKSAINPYSTWLSPILIKTIIPTCRQGERKSQKC